MTCIRIQVGEFLRGILRDVSVETPTTYRSLHALLYFTFLSYLRKHDTLIQAHARELTHLRQKIREGKGVCYLFIQHTKSIVKSFEGLLRSADIPYYQGQRFCEQLAQGSQLAESLASKLITGKLAYGFWRPLAPPKVLASHKSPCFHMTLRVTF